MATKDDPPTTGDSPQEHHERAVFQGYQKLGADPTESLDMVHATRDMAGTGTITAIREMGARINARFDARFDKLEARFNARFDKLEAQNDAWFGSIDAKLKRLTRGGLLVGGAVILELIRGCFAG